jgi:hypothetical protein
MDAQLNKIHFGPGLTFNNDKIDLNVPYIESIAQGATGPAGQNGLDGKDGLNGATGPQGATGSIPQDQLDEITDTLNKIDTEVLTLTDQSQICCNELNLRLNDIDNKLKPIYINVPVPYEVIVYKEKIVTVTTIEYRDTQSTIYVHIPCNQPLPAPEPPKVIVSPNPIPTPPSNVVREPINKIYHTYPKTTTTNYSPRTINGKTVYVDIGDKYVCNKNNRWKKTK